MQNYWSELINNIIIQGDDLIYNHTFTIMWWEHETLNCQTQSIKSDMIWCYVSVRLKISHADIQNLFITCKACREGLISRVKLWMRTNQIQYSESVMWDQITKVCVWYSNNHIEIFSILDILNDEKIWSHIRLWLSLHPQSVSWFNHNRSDHCLISLVRSNVIN